MQTTQQLKKSLRQSLPKNSAYMELILSFITVAFFAWFAIRPTVSTITELLQEIEVKQEILTKLDNKIDALIIADTAHKSIQPRLFLLDESLPSDHTVANYTAQLETIAQQVGADLLDIQFGSFQLDKNDQISETRFSHIRRRPTTTSEESVQPWRLVDFQLTAGGTYLQLKNLVSQLYQLRRITLTNKIEFQPNSLSGEVNTDRLNLQLEGQVLYL